MAQFTRLFPVVAFLCVTGPAWGGSPAGLSVHRTSHGVVHITAQTYTGLGYGLGFTYATDNLCQMADQIVTSRGMRSQFHGGGDDNPASDTIMRAELSDRKVSAMFATTSHHARALIRGFVAGYNRYLSSTPPPARDPACGSADWIMPMRDTDVYRMIAAKVGSVARFASSLADTHPAAPDRLSSVAREPRPATEASNGWAFGKDATADGRGLLLANPHFPWSGENRFYQLHLTIPGEIDVMGATIAPIPVVAIGFNKDIAWTHTVSPASRLTLFRLSLDPSDPWTYRVDGQSRRFSQRTVSFFVKGVDGALRQQRHIVVESIYGPVVTSPRLGLEWGHGQAFALADVNEGNAGQIDTWLAYARAQTVEDIRAASQASVALPWLTTEAADRNGQALFGDFSRSPNVDATMLKDCQLPGDGVPAHLVVLDGSRSRCDWARQRGKPAYVAGENLPSITRTDFVANSNDSYWLVNDTVRLPRAAPLLGGYAGPQDFRTRMGLTDIRARLDVARSGSTGPFTPDVAQEILFSERNYAAVTFLDDVLSLCSKDAVAKLAPACAVLSAWDRRNTVQSRGAVLFREFWSAAAAIPNLFAVPFSPDDPVNTPRGLRTSDPQIAAGLLAALAKATEKLGTFGIPLDRSLGEIQNVVRNGERIPIPGGVPDEGVLNAMLTTPLGARGYAPVHGTSYIQIVGFDTSGPVARGLLAYGQSTDPRSAWFSDQTRLFSKSELYRFPFSETDMVADPGYETVSVPDDPILRRRKKKAG